MKNWSFRKKFVVGLLILLVALFTYRHYSRRDERNEKPFSKNEILHLEISGVIMNGKKFLSQLKKYKNDTSVKAIVIEINSPGGAVGPSQEIYLEIIRAKKETKKPVICSSTGLMASGGYYAALGCDKIVVAPGALVGSIGVIMEFANLEKLYDWAKISRYTITSGKFKDSGSEYRAMRADERELFQNMITEVYEQFRDTVAEARHMKKDSVTAIADGRVMTGAGAVKLGLADQVGTFEDALSLAAETAHLGKDFRVFHPKKERMNFLDFLPLDFNSDDEDDLNSLEQIKNIFASTRHGAGAEIIKTVLKTKYMNQPLFLMPGYWD